MENILVINASGGETRVALVENGHIAEYYLDRKRDRGIVGNIYKGKVVRVLPGMQAAFVDIGLEKAAFLYVADVFYDPDFSDQEFDLTEGEHADLDEPPALDHVDQTDIDVGPAREDSPALRPAGNGGRQLADDQVPPSDGAAFAATSAAQPTAEAVQPDLAATQASAPSAPPTVTTQNPSFGVAEEATLAAPSPQTVLALGADPRAPEIAAPANAAETSAVGPVHPDPQSAAESSDANGGGGGEGRADEGEDQTDEDEEDDREEEEEEGHAGGEGPEHRASTAASAAADGQGAPPEQGSLSLPRPSQSALQRDASGRRRRRRRRGGKGNASPGPGNTEGSNGAAASSVSSNANSSPSRNGAGPVKESRRPAESRNDDSEAPRSGRTQAQIQDLLKEGQEIIVQVVKDPIGTKGARVTSHISLPGRHLVFMPTVDHVGISRRIENEKERKRLRDIINRMRPPGTGFIVRTVAEGVSDEKLAADIRFLIQEWNQVGKGKDKQPAPALLHPDLDMVLRATRDLFTHDVGKLLIDDRDEYERVLQFVENLEGDLKNHIELYTSEEPIFDAYGIEQEIKRALNRKVWLKSGGYLIIDQAEALIAVDVNSGRYVGKKNLEETITRINIEAAKEIVYQLRLRNIGGIIIIDFIDMDKAQNRDKVFKAMQEALGRDRAKTNVLKISELGLIEMTRKRVRESIGRTLNEPCPYCDGEGQVKSKVTMAYEIFREIRREAQNFNERTLVVNCHPQVAELLTNEERTELRYLMDRYNKAIQVKAQPNYHQEQYDIHGKSAPHGRAIGNHGSQAGTAG